MTGTRITAAGVRGLSELLGDRDMELIRSLGQVRVATTRQLERLHFHEGTPLSNARVCRRTLDRLTGWKVLERLNRRIGGVRAGSASFVYVLAVAGQRLLGAGGPAGGRRYQRPWTPSAAFLGHALAVTELYVRLVEGPRRQGFELMEFQGEPRCWRSFTGPGGEPVSLKPDAFVRLATPEFIEHAFVEVDRGTESPRGSHGQARPLPRILGFRP
jgi:hypothetical protein